MALTIGVDDLRGPDIAEFLQAHLDDMRATSPPESKHALDLAGLRQPDITFWTLRDDGAVVGCVALKTLDDEHGEIKSMRTHPQRRGQGLGAQLLQHLIDAAASRGLRRLSLETGSMAYFEPARALYARFGFQICPPFGSYVDDPHSVFMTLTLPD